MCEETRRLVNETDASGSSFVSSLERGFSLIAQSLGEYDRINDQLSETIDHAAHTIGAMSAFIDEIEKIGIEIRMIALNACIRAAHVGEHGAALGVLADTIHDLSAETTASCGRHIGRPEDGHRLGRGPDQPCPQCQGGE